MNQIFPSCTPPMPSSSTVAPPCSIDTTGNASIDSNTGAISRDHTSTPPSHRCELLCGGCSAFCKKYFWEGQLLNENQQRVIKHQDPNAPVHKRLINRFRRPLGMLIPAIAVHICWWSYMIRYNKWSLFATRYFMSLTMIIGSLVAGMTSEGGGAVAFPVMTLAFKINASVARDFSVMIQASGMSCASFAIFFMGVEVERSGLICCGLGGLGGLVFGLEVVDKHLDDAHKKMAFVSIWFSFAFALFLLNRYHSRKTFHRIPKFCAWKAAVLVATGLIGGFFTSFAGSGLDICSFSILTLLFRVSEKVTTPTSVVLMATNSLFATYWRGVMQQGISQDAYDFLACCMPVVVIGAPFGAVLGSHFHRLVLASFIYIIDTVALIAAFAIVPQTGELVGMSLGIIISGFAFFLVITKVGQKILDRVVQQESSQPAEVGGTEVSRITLPSEEEQKGRNYKKQNITAAANDAYANA